jgi:hypothetical protein
MAGDCVPRFRSTAPEIPRSRSDVSGGLHIRWMDLPLSRACPRYNPLTEPFHLPKHALMQRFFFFFFIVEIGAGIVAYPHALVGTGCCLVVVCNVVTPPRPVESSVVFDVAPIGIVRPPHE